MTQNRAAEPVVKGPGGVYKNDAYKEKTTDVKNARAPWNISKITDKDRNAQVKRLPGKKIQFAHVKKMVDDRMPKEIMDKIRPIETLQSKNKKDLSDSIEKKLEKLEVDKPKELLSIFDFKQAFLDFKSASGKEKQPPNQEEREGNLRISWAATGPNQQ